VPEPSVEQIASLRERKKARTRRMLIDAAVDLCLKQGYENTTVEQISMAADISPRTFSRYFASKDAVFIAVLDDLATEIVAELIAHPTELGPLEELRAAHMAVLSRVAKRPLAGLTADRIVLILKVVYSSPTLRQAAIEYRSEPALAALAKHMGVPVDDKRVELAVALFSTTIVSACTDVVASATDVPLGPDVIMQRLEQTLGDVAHFAAELRLP
jgi:AcrR family transcriptional regulator